MDPGLAPFVEFGKEFSIQGSREYEIVVNRVLGVGGNAIVVSASDIGGVSGHSTIALKFSRKTEAEAELEAWISLVAESKLSFFEGCESLVPVLDSGKLNGRLWIMLPEYMGTVSDVCKSYKKAGLLVPEDFILGAAVDGATALQHMHAQGLAHLWVELTANSVVFWCCSSVVLWCY